VDFAERAARNEEIFRSVNERIEAGAELHRINSPEQYHCECDRTGCFEFVELRPAEYRQAVEHRYHFVTSPGHLDPRVEQLVESHEGYWVVEKIGEAREAIDRRHPQQGHHS
jgi:hypothetical protein